MQGDGKDVKTIVWYTAVKLGGERGVGLRSKMNRERNAG